MKLFKALTFCILITQSNFAQWTNPDLTLTGRLLIHIYVKMFLKQKVLNEII